MQPLMQLLRRHCRMRELMMQRPNRKAVGVEPESPGNNVLRSPASNS